MWFSIRRKIFLGLMVIVIPFVVVMNLIMQHLLNDIAHQEIVHGLENSILAYHRFDEQRRELMLTQANSMAQTAHLKATLTIPDVDTETIHYAGIGLKDIANTELMLIISDSGELLSDINNKDLSRKSLIDFPGIEPALNGSQYHGIWEYNQYFFRVAIAPSVVGEQVVGLIAIGQRLDSFEAMQLARDIAGTKVILSVNDRIFPAESLTRKKINTLRVLSSTAQTGQIIGHKEGVALAEITIAGNSYFKATIPHQDIAGGMIFYRSIGSMASSVDPIRKVIWIISALTILFGTLFSLWISSRISKPILKLTQVAKEYGNGHFDLRVEPGSKDEVGELTVAFNSMADDIIVNRQNLLASIEAAEAGSRAKSTFLATMSHEIRTPLNGLLGMADLLRNTPLDVKQKRFVKIINTSGENLLDIINNILDFSKIESGNMELNNSEFNLRRLVEEISSFFSTSIENKGLEFICNIAPNASLLVQGDEVRLRQILANLISNAVKFTQDGYIELKVSVSEQANAKARIRFEVSDTGIGIKAEKLDAIFQSFVQEDGSTTRQFGGTGLGLAIAKELVELMGGTIQVNSKVGFGTCFHFEVTLTAMTLPDEDKQKTLLNLKGRTVLIVDDVSSNREILEQQLDAWGIHSQQAASGQETLDILHQARKDQRSFDMALLDYNMPAMNGIQLAEAIKQEECFRQLPLALLSCASDPEIERKSKLIGIKFCISKPISQLELYGALISMVTDKPSDNTESIDKASGHDIVESIPSINAHILVVEDTLVNQEVTAIMLDSYGCSYTIVVDGVEALDIVNKSSFDLILMDCQMPNMDGYEATAKLRDLEKKLSQPRIPVIALTANAIVGDRDKCLKAGMDDYLTKPFNQKTLSEILLKWLGKNSIDNQTIKIESSAHHNLVDTTNPFILGPATTSEFSDVLECIKRTEILDDSVLAQFRQIQKSGHEDFIERIKQAFTKDAPDHIKNLLYAAEHNDADALYKAAHALKSSSSSLGAKRLAILCQTIEKIGRNGSTEATQPLIALLEPVYRSTIDKLGVEQFEAVL